MGRMMRALSWLAVIVACTEAVDVTDISAGKAPTQASDIQEVTASNSYNARSAPKNACDNNQETFWSSQLGQSNAFLRLSLADGKPLHHVKSIQVKYYGKRSARLTRIHYRSEKGRTLTLVDERPYGPLGKLGDMKKSTRYTFKLSDDLWFSKTKKETGNSGRDADCFDVFDAQRDLTEGQGTRLQELEVLMEGAQQQLNGQDVLSIAEINYSSKLGCKDAISVSQTSSK